jgi:hypothetical protein
MEYEHFMGLCDKENSNFIVSVNRDKCLPIKFIASTEQAQPYSLLTSAPGGIRWLKTRPGQFTPRNDPRFPLYRRLSVHQGQSERM